MRAAVLYDVDDIRIEERAIPELGNGEVLVRTMASGICSGDVMAWYIRRKAPLVLGHEPAGIVAETRGDVGFSVGDRVFVHHHAPCFDCRACARGQYVQCATWRASKIDPGGIAEYFRVGHANLRDTLRVPQNVGFPDASLVEPLACVVKSLRRGSLHAGDRLYVIGLGVMGLLHVLAGRSLGAEVFASDFIAARRSLAERNGAVAFHPDDAGPMLGRGADVVICGPGNSQAMQSAVQAVARRRHRRDVHAVSARRAGRDRLRAAVFWRPARGGELFLRAGRHACGARLDRDGYGHRRKGWCRSRRARGRASRVSRTRRIAHRQTYRNFS